MTTDAEGNEPYVEVLISVYKKDEHLTALVRTGKVVLVTIEGGDLRDILTVCGKTAGQQLG